MARQVQLAILPGETPQIQGLDIAARYVPMSSVAGDFYDFIAVDETHVGILIADVSGHGLPSALIASMLQSALAAQSAHASEAARVLAGLNRALRGKFPSHFVTAAYLFLDLEKGVGTHARAGHPPLLLWRESSGSVTEILENGLFLGPFDHSAYSAVPLALEGGDRIILCTDGSLKPQIRRGRNSAWTALRGCWRRSVLFLQTHSLTPSSMMSFRWSEKVSGPSQSDDITLLAIDFQGASVGKYDS
jgi:serine phosphatase RsbU (regulator of sigma subunit)